MSDREKLADRIEGRLHWGDMVWAKDLTPDEVKMIIAALRAGHTQSPGHATSWLGSSSVTSPNQRRVE